MEASQQPPQEQQAEAQPAQPVPQASPSSQEQPVTEQQAASQPAAGHATPPAEAEAMLEEQDVDRNPAEEQSPVATAAQDAIIGDPGFRDEQNPAGTVGAPLDTPVRTSAPPAELQSGMPLPEDRALAEEDEEAARAQAGGREAAEARAEAPDVPGSAARPPQA